MIGLGLICGHLVGDYILQNDWMARNKVNPIAGDFRYGPLSNPANGIISDEDAGRVKVQAEAIIHEVTGHLACTVHCLLYALAVWAFSFWWMPWWGLVACFVSHWPVDRLRLAGRWMRNVSGQRAFASPPPEGMAPWSVIVVDNTFHLVTLFVIAILAGAGP